MISTHILDTSIGSPAQGVTVELEKRVGENWTLLGREQTDSDGRIVFQCPPEAGSYRLQFKIDAYFQRSKFTPFFTLASVVFQITDLGRKYHIPLLLNPYGYSTYRGS